MRARIKTLERLRTLYKAVEHTDGLTLDHARAAVHFAELKIKEQAEFVEHVNEDGLRALRAGDFGEWQIDQSQIEFAGWNAAGLDAWKEKRREQMAAAAEVYRESRMQLEQMESVLVQARAQLRLEDERSEQRASDDRFLSRKRWLEQQRRSKGEGLS